MHAENAIGLGIGEDLDEAVRRLVDLGAAVRRERKLADFVFDAGGLEIFLTLPNGSDLGERVDDVGNDVVVHVAGLAARISATAMPSSSALCASMGPAITSPRA